MQAREKKGTWVWGGAKGGIRVILKSLFLWGERDPPHRQPWHLREDGTKNRGQGGENNSTDRAGETTTQAKNRTETTKPNDKKKNKQTNKTKLNKSKSIYI